MKLEEHMRAIGHTKITIIVFSKSYTESACSLLELEKIIECYETFGQIVVPVFYEIDPLDVRHQKDDFGKTLEDTAHRSYAGKQLQHARSRWSSALNRVAGMTGWDVRYFRHDAQLVEVIVRRVKELLDYKDMFITQYPVALLESRVEDVIKYIENQPSKVCIIGIWGFRGSGYVALQENLLSDVLKSKLMVGGVGIGRIYIQNEFCRRKLLIVLDDVNEFGQLENLCGSREWFGQGTVIIITTRDLHLLKQLENNYVYQNESLEAKPRKKLKELDRDIVNYCEGLPLALQFLGSYLCDKTIEGWRSLLRKLQRIHGDNLLKVLKISFDGLRDTEKDILLDLCCFFKGKEKDYVTDILNGCGLRADIGITVLIQRGLIKVDRNNKLQMHPLLQYMGREIIRQVCPEEPGKRSRLWLQDDVKDVLIQKTGTEAIQGLSLKLHSTSRDCFKTHAFKEMKKLRLLRLDHVQLVGDYGHISKELRWICWKGFPSKYIPKNLYMGNVIAIDLRHSHLQYVWKPPQILEQLQFLNLSHSKYLKETPDFSRLPSLEQLILKDCPSLLKVHPSIADLSNIRVINLKDCKSLRYLPREVYKLKSLKTLILSGCSKVGPIDISQVKSLVNIICLKQNCETNIDEL
ncbi:TMV resistance protein N-like [Vigna radiata var. radiata]|uniref:TMV resistance protein N-like n=1 Tax=Vigna radiata var. radiata TaxID=3916 RepID=A0A3Q0FEP3_VIGRR|nr:TMV resistance protein N-like [Vigna radiata var. radiata]